jgi:hypothetical protein
MDHSRGLEYDDALVVARNIGQRRFTEQSWSYQHSPSTRRTYSQRWDDLVPPHRIRGLAQDRALILTVEGTKREIAAHVLVEKPPAPPLQRIPYTEPQVPLTPPPTIWEQRDQQAPTAVRNQPQQALEW